VIVLIYSVALVIMASIDKASRNSEKGRCEEKKDVPVNRAV